MKKSFITLAVLIIIFPHLGFPQVWKDVFVSVAAALIIILSLSTNKGLLEEKEKSKKEAAFVENAPRLKENEQTVSHE
jgi:hypothetical protein